MADRPGRRRAGASPAVPFGRRVLDAVAAHGPLCAGIDPAADLLPRWNLPDDAAGLASFADRCVEAFAGTIGVVKPQVAFFERHGAAGMAVLEDLVAAARSAGLLVITDAKRADIGSTMAAYADAWVGEGSRLAGDAVTAVPYLGLGSLEPLFDLAKASGRGVLVVVRSSNPEARWLQEARSAGGAGCSVEAELAARIAARNRPGGVERASVGAVVGATLEPDGLAIGAIGGPVLAPGVGAQGATAADVGRRFADCPPGSVLPSASRSLLEAGPDRGALAGTAARLRDELVAALPAP